MTLSTPTHPDSESPKMYFPTKIRAENWWIEQARKNPARYAEYISGFKLANHQLLWLHQMFKKNARVNIIAFPGSSKTFTSIRAIEWLIGVQPWLTHMIVSVSSEQAEKRLAAIRETIEIDERFANVFPWIHIHPSRPNKVNTLNVWADRWGMNGNPITLSTWMRLYKKYGEEKDSTLFAAGINSKRIIGNRITGFLLVDDAHDEENSATVEGRRKVKDVFTGTLLTRMVPGSSARAVNICNRWAEDDLGGELMDQKDEEGNPVWDTTVTPIYDENEKPTWEEVWDSESITKRANAVGGKESPRFKLSYLNISSGRATGEVLMHMLSKDIPPDMELEEIYISTDFAHKDSMKNDWTVYSAIGRNKKRPFDVYLLDVQRFKQANIEEKVLELINFWEKISTNYGIVKDILMEENDSQAEEQKLRSLAPGIPVNIVKTKGNKIDRFRMFAGHAQSGKFYMKQRIKNIQYLKGELVTFPGSKFDDFCDSISLPFQLKTWRIQYSRDFSVTKRKIKGIL